MKKNNRPTLIEESRAILRRLSDHGWSALFLQHGLDICALDLRAALSAPLKIDRSAPGFEDFALEGCRGIEPGIPAQSLLFHGLASPGVTHYRGPDGLISLAAYPTARELEILENLVYGLNPPTLEEVRVRAGEEQLAIVVFAKEYRTSEATVHRRHADFCYSRTGVSRVGTRAARYEPEHRGFLPFVDDEPRQIRVLPCRFAAYIAVLVDGDPSGVGPMRFRTARQISGTPSKRAGFQRLVPTGEEPGDDQRKFWSPLHKLFNGESCLRGRNLRVQLAVKHVNEKLRRIHLRFGRIGHDGGWHRPAIDKPPFRFTDGIAALGDVDCWGEGLVLPTVHPSMVAAVEHEGRPLTFVVPPSDMYPDDISSFVSSLNLAQDSSGGRSAPEYVHARHAVGKDGTIRNLNDEPKVEELVKAGGYPAVHYTDFTGDGAITARCSALSADLPRREAAYSIVAPPDFFPLVKQRHLMDWWEQSVAPDLSTSIWPENPGAPQALSDVRMAANQDLDGSPFSIDDDTVTAVVAQSGVCGAQARVLYTAPRRATSLPDGASGIFAPGWDVSFSRTSESDPEDDGTVLPGKNYLSSYGLGSPFPEDAKLCAALSAFWPAASPDIARQFAPRFPTATPLTDAVVGHDGKAWDATPLAEHDGEGKCVRYYALAYADYVEVALREGFDLRAVALHSSAEYLARTLVMGRVYAYLGASTRREKGAWAVLSFRPASSETDAVLAEGLKETDYEPNPDHFYRFELFQREGDRETSKDDFRRVDVHYRTFRVVYADPGAVIEKDDSWTIRTF